MTSTESTNQEQPLGIDAAYFIASESFEKVVKDEANDFFNSKFASLKSVLRAITSALRANNLMIRQFTTTVEGRQHLTTLLVHVPSGQQYVSTWELHPAKSDPQGEASALTYARRYAILTMMGLVPEDDDGNDASTAASKERQAAEDDKKAREMERERAKAAQFWIESIRAAGDDEAKIRAVGNRANTERALDIDLGGGMTVRTAVQKRIAEVQAASVDSASRGPGEGEQPPSEAH